MGERFILGIDIGTTSVKTILISSEGFIADETTQNHDLLSLFPGWAEEDADQWWQDTVDTVQTLVKRNPDKLDKIAGIGVSGMVPAIVILDENDHPVRNTIQQNDARAISQIEKVTAALDQDELFAKVGGYTNQQHVIPRLLWVKENEPENYARGRMIFGSYDLVAYKLTGVPSIEVNWAVESGMYDIREQKWITEYMDQFGIDPALFPDVHMSEEVIGSVSAEAAAVTGLPEGIPVIAGAADHVASTLAAGITEPGDLLIKFGGAGDILYCVDEINPNNRLFFDYHLIPGQYLLNGCMAASGSLVKWLTKDILEKYDGDALKEMDAQAEADVPPGSDGLVVLPYFIGEKTPIFDPTARGVMFGLTLSHTKAHLFRACLEAVIYGFRHHIDVLAESGYEIGHVYATNGGSKSRFWCQIASDILNVKIKSFPHHPGSSLGVAFLAGKSLGLFDKWEMIEDFLSEQHVYEPIPEHVEIYRKSYKIYRDLYEELKPSFADVQKLYD